MAMAIEEGANADAENFRTHLKDVLLQGQYSCQQTFNADECTLFWKTMPLRDRISLLFCSNTSGDLKIKPLVVYKEQYPRCFQENHVVTSELPVMWKSHPRAWINRALFMEWLQNAFAPTVRNYLQEKRLPIKCLLILNNGPAHPTSLLQEELEGDLDFIKVIFLPPHTSQLLQPMDQQLIATFKKNYVMALFTYCHNELNEYDYRITFTDHLRHYFNIFKCIHLIEEAWEEVTPLTLRAAWRNLWPWPFCIHDCGRRFRRFHGIRGQEDTFIQEIITLGHYMGLQMERADVQEIIGDI